jgi:hypothetical protein
MCGEIERRRGGGAILVLRAYVQVNNIAVTHLSMLIIE